MGEGEVSHLQIRGQSTRTPSLWHPLQAQGFPKPALGLIICGKDSWNSRTAVRIVVVVYYHSQGSRGQSPEQNRMQFPGVLLLWARTALPSRPPCVTTHRECGQAPLSLGVQSLHRGCVGDLSLQPLGVPADVMGPKAPPQVTLLVWLKGCHSESWLPSGWRKASGKQQHSWPARPSGAWRLSPRRLEAGGSIV